MWLCIMGSKYYNDDFCMKVAFHAAVNQADLSELKRLLESGADPNTIFLGQYTPMHLAVERRAIKVVDMLIESGARVDIKDADGVTSLQLALNMAAEGERYTKTGAGKDYKPAIMALASSKAIADRLSALKFK